MGLKADAEIAREVETALARVLGPDGSTVRVRLEEPRERAHGDRSTPDLLALAKRLKRPPRPLAEAVAAALPATHRLWQRIEVAGPGFVNFHLTDLPFHDAVSAALDEGPAYGRSAAERAESVLVEFVSANPVGPLNIVSARAAAVGDALAAVLGAAGHRVSREFYVNDAGTQVRLLGESVVARARESQGLAFVIPENGYHGEYVKDLAGAAMAAAGGAPSRLDDPAWAGELGPWAVERIRSEQEATLARYGVRFDRWASEKALHASGAVRSVAEKLTASGHAEAREGALWLKTTEGGDDKDRVLVRSSGEPTYFTADLAYHEDKFARGFERLIDLWGPDHHGHVARMKAGMAMLGRDSASLEIVIVQQVSLLRGREKVQMSKRAGQFVTLDELLDDVGVDAARFFFLLRSATAHLDFDLELAKKAAADNPVYYAQYAHARIRSILRKAAEEGAPSAAEGKSHLGELVEPEERDLARAVDRLPHLVRTCAALREPHLLTGYALDLAREFHSFYAKHKVIDLPAHARTAARLALVEAVRISLANALGLLGVRAPDSM